jgi:hypothetical protein
MSKVKRKPSAAKDSAYTKIRQSASSLTSANLNLLRRESDYTVRPLLLGRKRSSDKERVP